MKYSEQDVGRQRIAQVGGETGYTSMPSIFQYSQLILFLTTISKLLTVLVIRETSLAVESVQG